MTMIIDYTVANECENHEVYCTCVKCGKCGRRFDEAGIMINDGGTTVNDGSEEC